MVGRFLDGTWRRRGWGARDLPISDPPPQGIVGGAGSSPSDCGSALLTRYGLATDLVIHRAPHWNVAVLVPSELAVMLEDIGGEPYLRQ